MTELDEARKLLIASYRQSALRVKNGLDGRLTVTNAREPGAPATHPGEVVGLCGQGGRHSYFRLPAAELCHAADSILALEGVTTDVAVESLVSVSQRLRRNAVFDDASGCVNDRLPAIVPLLPPEEIWLDGRELPLDVWRLLSCEIDFVSSSLAAHVPLSDIAFGSLTPAGLAFRSMMSRMQAFQVEIAVSAEDLPASYFASPTSTKQTLRVALARLFFAAGCLLTPVRQSDIVQWYAALRYQDWIDNTPPRLAVRDQLRAESVDSRYRGLFAEEMGVGMMAVCLEDILGARPIVNTVEFLAATNPPALATRGPIADFVAATREAATGRECSIIAESKGSLGSPVSNARKSHAKQQAAATRARIAGSATKLPLAFCSSVFFTAQGRDAECTIADPPVESSGSDDLLLEPALVWRTAYAKALRFVGLDAASGQALRGAPVTALSPMFADRPRERDQQERDERRWRRAMMAREQFGAELLLDAGPCAVGIDPRALGLLQEAGISEVSSRELSNLADLRREKRGGDRRQSFLSYLGLGCIFYDELEQG